MERSGTKAPEKAHREGITLLALMDMLPSDRAADGATVYTDEARADETLPLDHEAVKHSVCEYVPSKAHPYPWRGVILVNAEPGS